MKKINSNNKVCIYLDQFVVSNLVSGSTDLWIEIKNLLEAKYDDGKIYCPLSAEHILETAKKELANAIIHDEYFRKISDNYIFKNEPFLTSQLISSLIRNNKFTLNTFIESKKLKTMVEIHSRINENNEIFDQSIKHRTSPQNELRRNLNPKADKKTEGFMFNVVKHLEVQKFIDRLQYYIDNKKLMIRADDYGIHQFPNWIDQLLYQLTYKHQFKEIEFKLLLTELLKYGFDRVATLNTKFSIGAYLTIKNKQEGTGDHIDLMRISSYLFSTDIFFTDKQRKFEICELGLDKKYGTQVFCGTENDLIQFKKYLENV